MTNAENRKAAALQAINRFAEARHHYAGLVDLELTKRSQIIDEYLAVLALAHVAESRCYIELDETGAAERILEQAEGVVRPRTERFVNLLLTSNPAGYLHPALKGQTDLRRLTHILQWSAPETDENNVFEMLRGQLFGFEDQQKKWIEALPPAVWDAKIDMPSKRNWKTMADFQKNVITLPGKDKELRVLERLPTAMATMEEAIENVHRLQGYRLEVQATQQLGLSFQEWLQLTPQSANESEIVYITLSESSSG